MRLKDERRKNSSDVRRRAKEPEDDPKHLYCFACSGSDFPPRYLFLKVCFKRKDSGKCVRHLPLCRVCLPPDSTPLGNMPVGVRPFRVKTFSLSSLKNNDTKSTQTQ